MAVTSLEAAQLARGGWDHGKGTEVFHSKGGAEDSRL